MYLITKIWNDKKPIMFQLYDLKGVLKGNFYSSQLRKSPVNPDSPEHWIIQKVIRQKWIDGIMKFRCRFVGYGAKYDKFFEEKQIPTLAFNLYKQEHAAKRKEKEKRKKSLLK